jgi:hypothetical protein
MNKIEVIKMALGFLRAFMEDGAGESYWELLDDDALHAWAEEAEIMVRMEVLVDVLEVLNV